MLLKMKIMNKFADQRFRAMADQTVQVFESIKHSLVFFIYYNDFKPLLHCKQMKGKKDEIGDLKLEAQRVK